MKKIFYSLIILSLVFTSCGSPSGEDTNSTPNAVDDSASTPKGTSVNINILSNDSFGGDGPNIGSITIPSGTSTNGGTILVNNEGTSNDPTDDTIDYTPESTFEGTDTFNYTITDSNGDTSTATVNVVVIPPTGPSAGTTFNDGVLKYTITSVTNKEVSVEKNTEDGPSGVLEIPQTIDQFDLTYTITSIADEGFAYSYNIT
ncbi:MAG: Ig-like domain-containing protein, partial [Polaribacter sp.]|nr:Ig-like domain-containing protein [Polaribacter sp.]